MFLCKYVVLLVLAPKEASDKGLCFCIWLGLLCLFSSLLCLASKTGVGQELCILPWPSQTARSLQTTYHLQGRSDLSDELVHMCTLRLIVCTCCCHVMRCHARHALDRWGELRFGPAMLGADLRGSFSVVEHGRHHWLACGKHGRRTCFHFSAWSNGVCVHAGLERHTLTPVHMLHALCFPKI